MQCLRRWSVSFDWLQQYDTKTINNKTKTLLRCGWAEAAYLLVDFLAADFPFVAELRNHTCEGFSQFWQLNLKCQHFSGAEHLLYNSSNFTISSLAKSPIHHHPSSPSPSITITTHRLYLSWSHKGTEPTKPDKEKAMFGRPWNIANHDLGKLKNVYFKEIKHYQSSAFLEHPFTTSWKIKSNLHKFKHFHFCISVFDVGSKHSSIYNWVAPRAFYFNLFKVVQIPTKIEHFLTKTI